MNLARLTPTITIYEYMAQPNENPEYGLKNDPELYQAVQRAWATITSASPAGPFRSAAQPRNARPASRSLFRMGWAVGVIALYLTLAGIYTYLGLWRYAIFRAGVDDSI